VCIVLAHRPAPASDTLAETRQAVELDASYLPDALAKLLFYTRDPEVLLRGLPAVAPDSLFVARSLEEQELWPQAKAFFRQAVAVAPDDGKPFYYREFAQALMRHGEDAEAVQTLQLVAQFDPRNVDVQLALAREGIEVFGDREPEIVAEAEAEVAAVVPILAPPAA
jgi:predicted Zn-dependent protease